MIDVHTHLLPGVDDGSPSVDVSLPVLQRFASDGVEIVVCTPHLEASRSAGAPYARHTAILDELRAGAPDRPELRLGWEIMLDTPGVDLRDRRLGLGGSTAVLVEFPRMMVPPKASEELFRMRMSGVVPVLAHPERYWGCTAAQVAEWRRVGAVIQMDAAGLLGGGAMAALATELLEQGLVDLLASDTHGDARALLPARQWLQELGAHEQAELLTRTNAARLLADEPTLPVPPVERRSGALRRLKELILGKRT
ncbi:MAG TPA: CpsB/CapC family capsule biosynthesis tyrosine phosphatase [Gemmatimonadaceae bacterium]|nr:CpsB/CapC family capsule biosynthesis tyrosine phosphatase [Gemmatimonadaceae bacterium]